MVALSPDGSELLAGDSLGLDRSGNSPGIKLWEVATGKLIRTMKFGHVAWIGFSPDGSKLLSSGGDGVRLWDKSTGKLIWTVGEPSSYYTRTLSFSPNGSEIATADGNKIKLWNASTGILLRTFEGHSGSVQSLAFSPDGSNIISGSSDTTIRIWKTATGQLEVNLYASEKGEWLAMTPAGFFAASPSGGSLVGIVRGLDVIDINQIFHSLYAPDLVREALAGDPTGEVERAGAVVNLDKVIDSGPPPSVEITSHPVHSKAGANASITALVREALPPHTSPDETDTGLVTITARIIDRGKGIGRIEWRVNGITAGVTNAPAGAGPEYDVKQTLALDPGGNLIEVVAYNERNLLASLPAQTIVTFTGSAETAKPKLHILAIGINAYVDKGWVNPSTGRLELFGRLEQSVADAKAFAAEMQKAGAGLYSEVRVRTALDNEATAAGLDATVTQMATEIHPNDTFVLFAAAHGHSVNGRFYLLPQDYQGGANPEALGSHAIDQARIQDWMANRIKAKKALILLDTCRSGALTNGYAHSRVDAPASEAAVGRLHEAIGRPVLTAAAASQDAIEYEGLGHGVFTYALLQALHHADQDGDGLITISELASYVQDLVPKLAKDGQARSATRSRGQGTGDQAARFGSTGDDFVFARQVGNYLLDVGRTSPALTLSKPPE